MPDSPAIPIANVSIITLGVENLTESTRFYEKLGWINTVASQNSVTFLQGDSVVLGLYGRQALAEDAAVDNTPAGFRGVTLARNFASETDVDAYFELAISAGAEAIKKPEQVFWGGYSGYFADLDGHLWEIAHNPFFQQTPSGQLSLERKG